MSLIGDKNLLKNCNNNGLACGQSTASTSMDRAPIRTNCSKNSSAVIKGTMIYVHDYTITRWELFVENIKITNTIKLTQMSARNH